MTSPSTSKSQIWSADYARLLVEGRQAAGLEQTTLAMENTLSLKQLQELETGGCSAFYSESIKYTTGVKLLSKLGLAFNHLELANEKFLTDAAEAAQVAPNKDEPIRDTSEPVTLLNSGLNSLASAWRILASLAMFIALAYFLFPELSIQLN
jgi:hypothetical protein